MWSWRQNKRPGGRDGPNLLIRWNWRKSSCVKLKNTGLVWVSRYFTWLTKCTGWIAPVVEVLDLTYLPNVKLFRAWDQEEFAYIQMLRFTRISSSNPTESVISKPGQHHTLRIENTPQASLDQEMDIADVPKPTSDFLSESPKRFSSTMMTMDANWYCRCGYILVYYVLL